MVGAIWSSTWCAQEGNVYPCVIKEVEKWGEQPSSMRAVGPQHGVQEAIEGLELALVWLAETPDRLQWVVLVQHLLQSVRILDALQCLHLDDTTQGKVSNHDTEKVAVGGGWWLFCSHVGILGGLFLKDHSLPAPFSFPFQWGSTHVHRLFRPGSVYNGSVSWDNCGQVFPE